MSVIELRAGTRIWLAAGVTDMRRGFHGLSAQVQTVLNEQPYSGHVFVFRGRRGHIIKCLWFDGDGLCLFAKRLERGRFVWPKADSGTVSLSRAQLSMLLEGIDWGRRKTNWRLRVQVPYDEGVAIHIGPESCAASREAVREALTGVHIGQPLSGERLLYRSVDAFQSAEDNTGQCDIASTGWLRAVWRTWHVCTSSVGNREVSTPPLASRASGRTAKAEVL
jgi:transposase